MKFEWDETKAQANLAKHGVAFETVHAFDFATAYAVEDDRRDYGEVRMVALGLAGTRVHHLVYTERDGAIRVISLRKANTREIAAYAGNIEADQGGLGEGTPSGDEEPAGDHEG